MTSHVYVHVLEIRIISPIKRIF